MILVVYKHTLLPALSIREPAAATDATLGSCSTVTNIIMCRCTKRADCTVGRVHAMLECWPESFDTLQQRYK